MARWARFAVAALLLVGFTDGVAADEPRDVRVQALPLVLDRSNPDRKRFGKLTWLGGLVLRSSAGGFGGFSGLAVRADGAQLLALSDRTSWVLMSLDTRGDEIAGVGDALMGRLKVRETPDDPARTRGLEDSEALAPLTPGQLTGEYFIAFEGKHRIHSYRFNGTDFSAPTGALLLPQSALRLPGNKGLEALTVLAGGPLKGTAIAFTEQRAHLSGDSLGWLFRKGRAQSLRLRRIGPFDITDAAALPDGGIIVLERHFAGVLQGVFMRLRRIAADDIAPGARLEGEVLYETKSGWMVDNMEALAVHKGAGGRIILTVMSDDNFNPIQRTLLMRFALD